MTKPNSDESLRVLSRLLLDEIVDDPSQSGGGCESRSVQKPSPSMDAVVVLGGVHRNVPAKAQSQVGRNISLMGKAHEEKEMR